MIVIQSNLELGMKGSIKKTITCASGDQEPAIYNTHLSPNEIVTELKVSIAHENLLLWVLFNHQGSNSLIGQRVRSHLGIGQFDRLTKAQLVRAKKAGTDR